MGAPVNGVSSKVHGAMDDVAHQSNNKGNQQTQPSVPQQSSSSLILNTQLAHIQNLPGQTSVTKFSQPIADSLLMGQSKGHCPPLHGYEVEMPESVRLQKCLSMSSSHFPRRLPFVSPQLLAPMQATGQVTCSKLLNSEHLMTPVTRYLRGSLPIAQAFAGQPLLATVQNMSQSLSRSTQSLQFERTNRATIGTPSIQGVGGSVDPISPPQHRLAASSNSIQNGLDASTMPTGSTGNVLSSWLASSPVILSLPPSQALEPPHCSNTLLASSRPPSPLESSPTSSDASEEAKPVSRSSRALQTCC